MCLTKCHSITSSLQVPYLIWFRWIYHYIPLVLDVMMNLKDIGDHSFVNSTLSGLRHLNSQRIRGTNPFDYIRFSQSLCIMLESSLMYCHVSEQQRTESMHNTWWISKPNMYLRSKDTFDILLYSNLLMINLERFHVVIFESGSVLYLYPTNIYEPWQQTYALYSSLMNIHQS